MSSPLAKRPKLSPPPDLDDLDHSHRVFTRWAQGRGVEINGVAPHRVQGRGHGLVTTKPIKDGERMLFVPGKAMFKPDTAFLKQHSLLAASPQAQLAISAMAKCREPKSASSKTDLRKEDMELWKSTWPTEDEIKHSIPLGWPPDYVKFLPHSARGPFARQRVDYRKDWDSVLELCKKCRWSEESFKYHWLIVNSRSFHWKTPNRRSGSMVLCPFIDYMNHGPTGALPCKVLYTDEGYEVVAAHDHEAGEEVLATYAGHSNDNLLIHYGFMCAPTSDGPSPDDEIRLDHIVLPKLDDEVQSQLQNLGFLGGYALIPSTNELCFKTQVAVRAQLLTCGEWEYFVANGEDLRGDKALVVKEFLGSLFEEYCKVANKQKELLEDMYRIYTSDPGREGMQAVTLLIGRWTQIISALTAFLQA